MKLHLFGASGAGVTTLGELLATEFGVPYFDTDAYYWHVTEPPFQLRRDAAERNASLRRDLAAHPNWILGGSMISWGEDWRTAFDAAVFLWVPPAVRRQRLEAREHARYGNIIFTDATRHAQYQEFLAWALGYDDNTARGRTLAAHETWLRQLPCPVLELRDEASVAERSKRVRQWLQGLFPAAFGPGAAHFS